MYPHILYGVRHGTGDIIRHTGIPGNHTTGIIITGTTHITIITITGIIITATITVIRIITIITTMVIAHIPEQLTNSVKAGCIRIHIPIPKREARDRQILLKNILMVTVPIQSKATIRVEIVFLPNLAPVQMLAAQLPNKVPGLQL